MANETNKTRIDSILDSFFAGCRKYDLYELAKKYATINPNDLFQMQQAITSKEITKEQMEYVVSTITVESPIASSNGGGATSASTPIIGNTEYFMNKYNQIGFYFGNDYPKLLKDLFNAVYKSALPEDKKRLALLQVSESLYRSALVMDQEINFFSCLIALSQF